VFCKSDCTHATNKGIPKAQVTAGLCQMMANKILELLKKVERRSIMITGGTAQNQMMIDFLRQEIPDLIVPDEAPYFEALGAALWAMDHETAPFPGFAALLKTEAVSFESLPPLQSFQDQVTFKTMDVGRVQPGDVCLLGLDVGSTTTKAVLVRRADNTLLASIYLRTNGDPVGASRLCYQAILDQIRRETEPENISIIGLGVCGSGRQIAGLHAMTSGVINEIIAHATASVFFDPQVDTVFEIGGQDAKYTYITNGVPSDYAMNEACSAGTGSFLEESALETLGVEMEDIADTALKGHRPPNFNDQCAAFIASDIKNAIHENISHEDIVAGLVYSICMNYANRVKGNRPVGEKVFMQGGVCYNNAVPLGMASLVGKPIIVPPEPGLMGAFGVALEIGKRLDSGLMDREEFDLQRLADRGVRYGKTFTCKGGREKCDRACRISTIEIEGRKYPFGGACNRYYNLRRNLKVDVRQLDLVRERQRLVFDVYGPGSQTLPEGGRRGRVGLNRSFLVNTYAPLYTTFFNELGFEVVLPDTPSQEGIDQRNAAFCYPAELAHGFFKSLLSIQDLDAIFLPHFKAVPTLDPDSSEQSQVCPLVQGETFYLRSTFKHELQKLKKAGTVFLSPLIDISSGLDDVASPLLSAARELGLPKGEASQALNRAIARQEACLDHMKRLGRQALADLESDPDRFGVVVVSRPYNGLVEEAHMGIPHKFASRNIMVIPMDFLDLDQEKAKRHMYWGMGQVILKAARAIRRHPQLFGTYVTNFSCGPDSFVVGYFREIMGRKPSLTLELDSHTADAGLETRVEAFIDVVNAYRQLETSISSLEARQPFTPARVVQDNGQLQVATSSGQVLPVTDPRVKVLLPSMGRMSSQAFAAILRGLGFRAIAHKPADESVLKLGRSNTSCKECLPLILTTGTLLSYLHNGKSPDEVLIYFFASGTGPCRFGQYSIFMEDLIQRHQIPDVAVMTISADNSYVGLGTEFERRGWWAIVVADTMEDIRSMLLANARDPESAMAVFENQWQVILNVLEQGSLQDLEAQLGRTASTLADIPLVKPPDEVPTVTLTGEIFVRRDGLSRQYITEQLARKGFATICSPIAEWVKYCNYMVDNKLNPVSMNLLEKFKFRLRNTFQNRYEKRIKSILSRSGLVKNGPVDIKEIMESSRPHISRDLPGEAVLTVGGALSEVVSHSCGVIAIGPFGCMPNRLSEAILNESMTREDKLAVSSNSSSLRTVLTDIDSLPFLAIESDGSPFPQLIHAKLEAFCLRAQRLHEQLLSG
jgi:predicted CoA-substrate-specific enzyme activase